MYCSREGWIADRNCGATCERYGITTDPNCIGNQLIIIIQSYLCDIRQDLFELMITFLFVI